MILNNIMAVYYYIKAKYLRKKGCYSYLVLNLFFRAFELEKNKTYLLGYIKCQRDLGFLINIELVEEIIVFWNKFNKKEQMFISALLLEIHAKHLVPSDFAYDAINQIPATLTFKNSLSLSQQQQYLLSIYNQQNLWRFQLAKALQEHTRGKGICIVGNAGNMSSSALGHAIDAAGFIVRFNAFKSGGDFTIDLGKQCNLWCVTPSFKPSVLHTPDWLLVTGPEMQYQLVDWSAFYPFCKAQVPILTLPLEVWQQLVGELQAPPSAGLSVLAFFYWLLDSWIGVSVAGFGALSEIRTNYHYMSAKNKASQRHNWEGEKRILTRWLKEGLTSLHN